MNLFRQIVSFVGMGLFILSISLLSGCGVYSFSGASIDPNAKTVSVAYLENNAIIVIPTLSQSLTEGLKDKILNSTSLSLSRSNADIQFSGAITDYSIKPIAVQGNETTSRSRLTITVKLNYVNKLNEKQNWENDFSRYADFNSTDPMNKIQSDLIKQINDQLIEDIFLKAFVNW